MGEGPLRVKSCAGKEAFFCRKRGRSRANTPLYYLRGAVVLEPCSALHYNFHISPKPLSLSSTVMPMSDNDVVLKPKTKTKPKVERPKLYKIILVNDDYTPREFVIMVLKAVFRMSEETGYRVMMTAHKLGTCVVMVCARDIAETKAQEAVDLAKSAGFPLMFTTEPEE